MGAVNYLLLLLTNPYDFRTLLQFWLYHEPKRDIMAKEEHSTSGWDRQSMRRCWEFLDQTSRSFAAVIKELEGDLARVVCVFYLVLRGLDTIEDDMTIPDHIKQPILRNFHVHTVTPGWSFDGCGPSEKDRQLLVEYHVVVDELNRLPDHFKNVIVDVCQKMAHGMADYAHKAATTGSIYLSTVEEYDLYCHYVAGLVGEGLSGLFSASGKEASWLAEQLELSNSMGLFLQKVNIIRDYREDLDQSRYFWPKAIWSRFGFEHMREMHLPGNEERASHAQSAMILDALRHATDSLDYLKTLKNQSVFNFCAIPQTMAIATLSLCFMNQDMFHRNVKIRKAEAAKLIMRSTNPRDVATLFVEYARQIHSKVKPTDPNFIRISIACGRIEQWREHHYPSFIVLDDRVKGPSSSSSSSLKYNPYDARTKIQTSLAEIDQQLAKRRRMDQLRQSGLGGGGGVRADPSATTDKDVMMFIAIVLVLVMVVCILVVMGVLAFTGDLHKVIPPWFKLSI